MIIRLVLKMKELYASLQEIQRTDLVDFRILTTVLTMILEINA
jgi:hypothetical protein